VLYSRLLTYCLQHCNVISRNLVLVGAYRSATIQGDPINSELRNITVRRVHWGWNTDTFENDLLILKLDSPVLDKPILPINRNSSLPYTNRTLTVIGLGATEPRADEYASESAIPIDVSGRSDVYDREEGGDILQEVVVEVISNKLCNGEDAYNGYVNTEAMMCAGLMEGGKDACSGDSGGPLFEKKYDGSMIQMGLVSFGNGCARANRPGVYTRLSSYSEWIDQQICDLSANPPTTCFPPTTAPSTQFSTAQPTRSPSPPSTSHPSGSPTKTPTRLPSHTPINPTQAPSQEGGLRFSDRKGKRTTSDSFWSSLSIFFGGAP
jgi:Trypsin